jgi:hypothetical protein
MFARERPESSLQLAYGAERLIPLLVREPPSLRDKFPPQEDPLETTKRTASTVTIIAEASNPKLRCEPRETPRRGLLLPLRLKQP